MIRRLIFLCCLALAACASGTTTSAASPGFGTFGFRHHKVGTVTPSVLPSGTTYDTSIGNGVGTDGFASLPLNTGANRYYVNSSTGSDSNSCAQAKSPSTPKATLTAGEGCATNGLGDQILLAQGTSYSTWSMIGAKGGASATYPLVIESYDPSDPTNEAKLGRATGTNRPVILTSSFSGGFIQGNGQGQYRAFRGIKFDGQNTANQEMNAIAGGDGTGPSYLLMENDEFAQVQFSFEGNSTFTPSHLIVRMSALHGAWGSNRAQCIFANTTDGLTIEDSVFSNCGWEEGASRSSDPSVGGSDPGGQAHAIYIQVDVTNATVRRNVMVNNSTEAANLKGGGIAQFNLSLRNPLFISSGGGNNATIDVPLGVYTDTAFNAAIGSNTVGGTSGAANIGALSQYAKAGDLVRYNVEALSGYTSSASGLLAKADNDVITSNTGWTPPTVPAGVPSSPTFDHNVLDQWGPSGSSEVIGPQNVGIITATFTNNLWDDPTSGTNTNNSGATFPNAYTETTLLAALPGAYASESAALSDWIANTPSKGWEQGVHLALAGYGVTLPALSDLWTDMRITAGLANTGRFIGTQDGDVLTFSGLPACVTPDPGEYAWRASTSCTVGSGTFSVTETPATGLPHTTNIAWNIYPQPILSSLAVTPAATSATATVSANTGSETLYWMVSGSSTPPNWAEIKYGIDASTTSAAYVFGSQAVTATGSQSINTTSGHTSTALTAGNTYTLHVAQLDANNNPSATISATFTTSAWAPASLGANLALDFTELDSSHLFQDTGCTTAVTTDLQTAKCIKDTTTGIIATNSTGWVYHANSGKPYLQMDGVSFFATSGNVTYTDGTGQWSAWVAASPGTNGNNTLFLAGSHNMLLANPSLNRTSAVVWSSSAQLAGDNRAGTTINTPAVFAGIVNTTALTVEAFVNGSSDGATSYTGTADTTARSIQIGNTATGPFYGGFIEKALADATTQTNAETYMAALHP